MIALSSRRTETYYCTNRACAAFNDPQEFDHWTGSWYSPAEQCDGHDLECRSCFGDVHEYPLDDEEGEE